VLDLNLAAVEGLLPDRTFLLLLDPAEVSARVGGEHDRLEREDEAFHRRVDAGYRELAERFPERIVMLDGERPPEQIAEEVHGALRVSA
jgi:dTMP kinase